MKKHIGLFALILGLILIFTLGCSFDSYDFETSVSKSDSKIYAHGNIDYEDAESFEKALNDGTNLVGKVVQFVVGEVRPNSAYGYNIWAGEHLNFVSSINQNVEEGDIITVKVTNISNEWGSWIIEYVRISNDYDEYIKTQKDAFDNNIVVSIGCYNYTIPIYWVSDIYDKYELYRAYAEMNGKVAMLQIVVQPDDIEPVTYETLREDDEDGTMGRIIASWFDSCGEVSSEMFDNGDIQGFVYNVDFVHKGYSGECVCLCFPSEKDSSWIYVYLTQTDNTDYFYNDDFYKILRSISVNDDAVIQEADNVSSNQERPNSVDISNADSENFVAEDNEDTSYTKINDIVFPLSNTKLGIDYDSKSSYTAYYFNVDGRTNIPALKRWGRAMVTDGVSEYLDYLVNLGFDVNITDYSSATPYSGFTYYETYFEVSNSQVTWTMYLIIQDEDYIEYELDINLQ